MCSWFVTGTCHQLIDDDELGLGPSGFAQVFQHSEGILVCPVVEYSADEEDGDVPLLRWLRVKETVALEIKRQFTALERCRLELRNPGASRGHIQAPRACSSSRTVSRMLSGTYDTRRLGGFNTLTSTASSTTGGRSWTTKRRCG